MADLADVEAAIVSIVADALYPEGQAGASATGVPARVYRGWPVLGGLDADLAQGVVNVSVLGVPGQVRNTTRWNVPDVSMLQAATLTVAVAQTQAVFGGTADAGQLAGLLAGGRGYVYRTAAADTPASVAAALAQAISVDQPALAAGGVVTVAGEQRLVGRVSADAQVARELRRQEQAVRITLWCGDPASRDAVTPAIDLALAALDFITLPDGSVGRMRFVSTSSSDREEDAVLYRRDLVYSVEYPTVLRAPGPTMLFGDLAFNGTTILV